MFNQGKTGAEHLADNPGLLDLLVEMCRAQSGDGATLDDAMAALSAAYPTKPDEDEDD